MDSIDNGVESRLIVLGSGNAFNEDGRGSAALWLDAACGGSLLVDVGPTVMAAVSRFGLDLGRLDAVFVTHLHGDHVAGWPFLLLNLAFRAGRRAPLDVFGPTGTRDCLEGLVGLCYPDIPLHGDFEIRYHELPVAGAEGLAGPRGVRFDVVPLMHHASSIGYRLDLGDLKLAVSGDTSWCDGLEVLARGSDVLVMECTSVEVETPKHVALEELRRSVARLEAPQRVLVHLNDAVAVDLARDPIPGVLAAYDGWTFRPRSRTA